MRKKEKKEKKTVSFKKIYLKKKIKYILANFWPK